MKRNVKRKMVKTNEKVIISILVCIALVLSIYEPGRRNEALAVSPLTQPINMMYSLMMQRNLDPFEEMNVTINHSFRSFYKIKSQISSDNQDQIVEDKNVKPEIESQEVIIQNFIDMDVNSSVQVSESAKEEKPESVQEQLENKTIYLTFDDGPTMYTNNIVDTLNAYGMQATFFMLEPNMNKYPDELLKLINDGHVPALHGVTHDVTKIYRSEKTVVEEMNKAQETLLKLTGSATNLIRTPYGSVPHMKPAYIQAVKAAGYQLWDWTVDSRDWKYKNGEYVANVIDQLEKFPFQNRPIVILFHDKKTTAEHLPELLDYIKSKGYDTAVLNEQLTAYHF
ncbi:polysaccharide deacetylase [Bacillus sp. FJAT-29790]|uniref:polysaccharide deacetylase family protein n=1 Tax=Bacillus sp. FJAT-29790 TaxID=1895002 RepID=UPI001C22EBEC|nr:polysaccharide deacetylase family protein [Bacillus sp. FJAT-29790]MBU8877987.1 polysaccharide deacetylase [Bacillus sp. FJAT-29790]